MDTPEQTLEPLPYHLELRNYLKSQERELWNWFASAQAKADYTENLRMDLLKSTYRLDAESHPELYKNVEEAKARLRLDIPVTLYQAQNSPQLNAGLFFMPGEGHVVFSGPILTLLNPEELKSVFGHELAHYHLWGRDNGEFHIADRLIQAVANDPRAATSHEQTARRYKLYTEIFANGNVATAGLSHPEAFIRARALALWQERGEGAVAPIRDMIEGAGAFDELDLIGQSRLASATRRLLESLLRPKWFQTPSVLGHAKLFFHDLEPGDGNRRNSLEGLQFSDARLREYLCYVLLDFVTADPELEDLPLAAALELSRQLELDAQFEKLAAKELEMKIRDVRKIKEEAAEMLAKAEVAGE